MLRDCVVLALEGTHASGKTTLTHVIITAAVAMTAVAADGGMAQARGHFEQRLAAVTARAGLLAR